MVICELPEGQREEIEREAQSARFATPWKRGATFHCWNASARLLSREENNQALKSYMKNSRTIYSRSSNSAIWRMRLSGRFKEGIDERGAGSKSGTPGSKKDKNFKLKKN